MVAHERQSQREVQITTTKYMEFDGGVYTMQIVSKQIVIGLGTLDTWSPSFFDKVKFKWPRKPSLWDAQCSNFFF